MAKQGEIIKNYDKSPEMGEVDYVVEWQKPTEKNGYTWYRLYASGWCIISGLTQDGKTNYTLPLTMCDSNYFVTGCIRGGKAAYFYAADWNCYPVNKSQIFVNAKNNPNVTSYCWLVMGYTES